jgi:hypothetical protein
MKRLLNCEENQAGGEVSIELQHLKDSLLNLTSELIDDDFKHHSNQAHHLEESAKNNHNSFLA